MSRRKPNRQPVPEDRLAYSHGGPVRSAGTSEHKAAADNAAVAEARRIADQREALARRINGPWAPALHCVRNDTVMLDRIEVARGQGMPAPSLGTVPLHRRPARVEQDLDRWERSVGSGAGCSLCGSVTARAARGPHKALDAVEPGWAEIEGRQTCLWCASIVRQDGADHLARLIYAQVTGLRGTSYQGRAIRFAYEVQAKPSPEPWAYLDVRELRADAIEHYGFGDFSDAPHLESNIPGVWRPLPTRAGARTSTASSSRPPVS